MRRTVTNRLGKSILTLGFTVVLVGTSYPAVVPWVQQAEFSASNGAASDGFGYAIAVSGNTLVVGAPNHTVGSNSQQGAVYVFIQNGMTWSQEAELTASDGAAVDGFGTSVAISGGTILVGAPGHTVGSNTNQGAAYVFVQNGTAWSQQAELTASDGAGDNYFGASVAVSGSSVVVGAWAVNSTQGAAYVFAQNGAKWTQQAKLTASDEAIGDEFGSSVAISGSSVAVGAPRHPYSSGAGPGAAYVFVQSNGTWSVQAELTASDGAAGYYFADSLAIDGSTIVVGAPETEGSGSNLNEGAAYIFAQDDTTWSQQAELRASDGGYGEGFANSVAISGSTIVVGASNHNTSSHVGQGAAYVFVQSGTTWSQEAEVTAANGEASDQLGFSTAVTGSTLIAGAPGHMVGSNAGQGAVYAFGPGATTVTFTPASRNFGKETIGISSAVEPVTLKNVGTSTLNISNIATSTNFGISATSCGATLDIDKSCKVSVTFSPTEVGALAGTLSFTDDATPSPQLVWLSGTGVAQATLTPATWTFGTYSVGKTAGPKTFALNNHLPTTLTGISYSITGPFAVSATTCGTTLASKSGCTLSVTFTPTQAGTASGTFTVTNSANNSPQTVSLTGTGK